jgi:hypothetical protein
MSGAITLQMMQAAKAQAYLIAYDAKFQKAASADGVNLDYLGKYAYKPSINPGIHIVRMPIPLSDFEMKVFKGRRHFAKNSTGFMDLTSVPYDVGVEEDADRIAAFDWVGFSQSPERIANTLAQWESKALASLINTGESTLDWTGTNFLSTTKEANPFKPLAANRYRTYWANTVLNTTNVRRLIADMVARRGFNKGSLGFGIKDLVLFSSSVLYPTAQSICMDEKLAGGVSNPIIKYKMTPEPWIDLDAKRWGILQVGSAIDSHPVFGSLQGATDTMILGKDSAKYELTGKMGYNVKRYQGVGLLRSEAISVAVEP